MRTQNHACASKRGSDGGDARPFTRGRCSHLRERDPSDDPWYPHGRHRIFGDSFPITRSLLVERVFHWIERAVADGRFVVHQGGAGAGFGGPMGHGFPQPGRNEEIIIDQTFESPQASENEERK